MAMVVALYHRHLLETGQAMLGQDDVMDIRSLKKEGYSIKAIVRETGVSRNTVRSILRGEHSIQQRKKKRKDRTSILDPYKLQVEQLLEKPSYTGQLIFEQIKRLGYQGSVAQVYRYIQSIRQDHQHKQKLSVRFETPPGKQAQVDWGYCGEIMDEEGKKRKLYAFVMILGYSRFTWVKFTTSMKREVLLACHMEAFDAFGGIPQEILYDNMAQVRDGQRWNAEFMDFADHYGFIPKRCRPYRARTKGKVERAIKYLKGSFMPGREFDSLTDANAQVVNWLATRANVRLHGTTQARPCDLLSKDRQVMHPIAEVTPYQIISRSERTASYDGFVSFSRSRYSVPGKVAGKVVLVEQNGHRLQIRCEDLIVADHPLAEKPGMTISKPEHIREMWKLTLQQSPPPTKEDVIRFEQQVEERSLSIYEEVAQ